VALWWQSGKQTQAGEDLPDDRLLQDLGDDLQFIAAVRSSSRAELKERA
jgi:hypothetical protein